MRAMARAMAQAMAQMSAGANDTALQRCTVGTTFLGLRASARNSVANKQPLYIL